MGAPYLTYTLLMLITFPSGQREMVPSSGYSQEVCARKAAEDNANWKYRGDRETFKFVKYICIPSRKLP